VHALVSAKGGCEGGAGGPGGGTHGPPLGPEKRRKQGTEENQEKNRLRAALLCCGSAEEKQLGELAVSACVCTSRACRDTGVLEEKDKTLEEDGASDSAQLLRERHRKANTRRTKLGS